MRLSSIIIFLLLVFSSHADAQTGGEVYRTCLARNPWASAACNRTINTIFSELKFAGIKCDIVDASAKAVTSAVFDYLHANPQVHSRPIGEVIRDALRQTFHCE
jgi:hypothetical protein